MKRLLETLAVLASSPIWLPLFVAAAAATAISSGRPVLFRQMRAGKDGRPFRIAKFRTMREGPGSDAERLTRIGRMLRSTSLDELPQLFQVLTGTMSLVGPRPLPVEYLPRYTAAERRRHEVRPGITGWAQVNGRNSISWEEKFALDVWYVDNRSLALDLKIIFMTIAKALRRTGIDASAGETMPELRPDASRKADVLHKADAGR